MRLSEAILLGSTVLTPKAGQQYDAESRSGCALGMAAIAKGWTYGPAQAIPQGENGRSLGTAGVWGEWVNNEVTRPCNCWNWWLSRKQVPKIMPVKDIITHIFDRHVMLKKDWTLDELAKWVRTNEPPVFGESAVRDEELYGQVTPDGLVSSGHNSQTKRV